MAETISKWSAGSSCSSPYPCIPTRDLTCLSLWTDGPVLSQTDLYLLNPELEINPILTASSSFQLQFNIATGAAGGFNPDVRDRELPFAPKDEPATLPRVSELILITELSPWCTIVKNPQGVTLNDVCQAVWKE